MEPLGDDELLSIFNKIHDDSDRIAFYQVSKQFLKVACIRLRWLHIDSPRLLKDVLHASPYLVKFECNKPLQNTYMELVARSCPNLRYLKLDCYRKFDFDFDDDGLCAVAKACSRLRAVDLDGRLHVGDVGVDCLVRSCKDLETLSLSRCARVTDESLKSIRKSNRLAYLYLRGCLITDKGLEYLTKGDSLKNNLKELILDECDRISDNGISYLKQMVNLTQLSLSKCGVNITDSGIALSQIPNIEALNLSWLINVTDISLSHIASNCKKLEHMDLQGCDAITGAEMVILACRSLYAIQLSKRRAMFASCH
ncbi:Leucine-rich repeat, cysteine-containing subtype [Artemisia annua]|uniref:Leucine-rich repeat, cysteine-containing subtype n=1 Tax=Artemisia annua TaxID=35608 RepID=A0A2U1LZV3_ARTAN|nr:Leucine-rich repeat, cysteine-containing subtype [Artemisia annua]